MHSFPFFLQLSMYFYTIYWLRKTNDKNNLAYLNFIVAQTTTFCTHRNLWSCWENNTYCFKSLFSTFFASFHKYEIHTTYVHTYVYDHHDSLSIKFTGIDTIFVCDWIFPNARIVCAKHYVSLSSSFNFISHIKRNMYRCWQFLNNSIQTVNNMHPMQCNWFKIENSNPNGVLQRLTLPYSWNTCFAYKCLQKYEIYIRTAYRIQK